MRLKNDAAGFAASFNITPPYQMVVLHSSVLIYPREVYQRGVQRKRVELIASHFNEYTANEPKVSFRNGKYYVVDGQHTIESRILRNGGKDLPILCKVYTGLTMQQEALLFAEQNGYSAPLTAGIRLRAKVVGRRRCIRSLCRGQQASRSGNRLHPTGRCLPHRLRRHRSSSVQADGRKNLLRDHAAHRCCMGWQSGLAPRRRPEGHDALRGAVSRRVQ